MNTERLGYLLVFLSAASFSSSTLVAKWAYALGFTPYSFSLGASLWSLLLLALFVRRGRWLPPRGVRTGGALVYCLSGALSGLLFNVSLAYLDVSLATLLVFTFPAMVALGAWLWFGQRPGPLQAGAVGLTLLGVALTAGPVRGEVYLLGVALAVATALLHALYLLLSERLVTGWDPAAATAAARACNALICALAVPGSAVALAHTPLRGWAFLLLGAAVAAVFPFLFLMQGVLRVGASRAAIISSAELPISLLLGRFVMGDGLTWLQAAGALLIVTAVLLIALAGVRPGLARPDPD